TKARQALVAAGDVEPPRDPPPPPPALLLAAFDTSMLGWCDRDWFLPPEHASRVLPGGGILRPFVLIDGVAAGSWSLQRNKVTVDWFGRQRTDLSDEVADIARFLGVEISL